jgi:Tfp pilus assembly major pilin PilA
VAKPAKPFRVIELITLLVIGGIIVAITLPRCEKSSTRNQSPPPARP